MDISLEKWISELEMEDYFIDQSSGFDSVDHEFTQLVVPHGDTLQQSSSSESTTTTAAAVSGGSPPVETGFERPMKQMKSSSSQGKLQQTISPNTSSSFRPVSFPELGSPPSSPSINPQELYESLENSGGDPKDEVVSNGDKNNNSGGGPKAGQKRSCNAVTRSPLEAQDRVMAERKRREKLSQRFIALSAIVPGLKKMDKASVLGDAIKYLKQLQEHVKVLEEQINKKSEESVIFVKKSQLSADDDTSSCDENFDGQFREALPEIEVRFSEKNVLIRIHCEKQKGFAVKFLSEVEKLNMSVVNSSFLPFGQYAMDITVVAQMDTEFSMTVKDLVRNLRSAFLKFLS